MVRQAQRHARVVVAQCVARLDVVLDPPAVGMVFQRPRRDAQQHGVGRIGLAVAAQRRRPVIEQGGITGAGNGIQRRARALGAAGGQRDAGPRHVGITADARQHAAGGGDLAAPEQRFQPRPVVGGGQHAAMVLHDGKFGVGVESAAAPSFADQRLAVCRLAGGDQRPAKSDAAQRGGRRARAEPGDNLAGTHFRPAGGFGAIVK